MKKNRSSKGSSDNTVKIYQRNKISFELNLAKPDWTDKQKKLIEIIKDSKTQCVFIKGASGTSKTFLSLAVGLELLNSGRIKEIILIRSIVESGMISLGSLPGEANEKLSPFMAPFEQKMAQLLSKEDIKKLYDDKRIIYMPVNFLRGNQFDASYVIIDECQNLNVHEIQTGLTRLGKYSKLILAGDVCQIDYIKGKKLESGFQNFYDWYDTEESRKEGVHCFKFGISDIMRSDIIKYFVAQYDLFRSKHH